MRIQIPYYTTRDYLVLAVTVLPISVIINFSLLGSAYTFSTLNFLLSTLITGIAVSITFFINGLWAVTMKERFPLDSQVNIRLVTMLIVFFLLNVLLLFLLYQLYAGMKMFNISYSERRFMLVFIGMCIINIFLTLTMESIARYEKWNASLKEADEINEAFKRTQLQGLKSQLNPHFLFNCLNSLSSLINEDEELAETFLNEMSKVYRYMLRNEEDTLVPLKTELDFVESYNHLLQTRYGKSLELRIEVDKDDYTKMLPPLSLQILIENAFTQNRMSKASPLVIVIKSVGVNRLAVSNNVQPKASGDYAEVEAGLDNLVYKYQLIGEGRVVIEEKEQVRTAYLPLLVASGIELREEALA